jgi:hypothetical protein
LDSVGQMFRALHHLATQCDGNHVDSEMLSIVTEHMSMHGIRHLDACITKLGGTPMGNFAEVFEETEFSPKAR